MVATVAHRARPLSVGSRAPAPTGRHRRRTRSGPAVALSVAGAALMLAALPGIRPSDEGSAGLISVAGPVYLVGLALLSAGFVVGLRRPGGARWLQPVQVVTLVVLVVGVGVLVEPEPRLALTYTHLGFARYIATHGRSLPPIDARAGWPGAFALIAELETVMRDPNGFTIGRWAPLVFDLAAIPPLLVLGSVATADVRARWLAVWIFFTANWVEQDYLSPQALDFTLYLVVLGVMVAAFAAPGAVAPARTKLAAAIGRWRSRIFSGAPPGRLADYGAARRSGLLVLVVVVSAAMVVSHQLTPYVLVLDAALLVAIGRCRLGTMPWLLGLMTVAWLSFGASGFWTGHLELLTGSAGNVAGNVASGVSARIRGDLGHRLVIAARIAMVLGVATAAVVGVARQRARRTEQPWVGALAVAPVVLVAAQSYGGEVVIRTFLFSLPFLAILAAAAVFPGQAATCATGAVGVRLSERAAQRIRRSPPVRAWRSAQGGLRPAAVAAAAALAAAAGLLGMVAHYGTDQVDQVSPAEVSALGWLYGHVPPPATLFTVCTNLPWRYSGAASYHYEGLSVDLYTRPGAALDRMESSGTPVYFIATTRQGICGQDEFGLPTDWLSALETGVDRTGRARLLFDRDGARIYRILPHHLEPTGGTS